MALEVALPLDKKDDKIKFSMMLKSAEKELNEESNILSYRPYNNQSEEEIKNNMMQYEKTIKKVGLILNPKYNHNSDNYYYFNIFFVLL